MLQLFVAMEDINGQRKWRKVAYGGMQTGFDDNHTYNTFLQKMVMSDNVVKRYMLKDVAFMIDG
ncbi:hypothetical protein Lser_V15G18125 [Lactuca serriola]